MRGGLEVRRAGEVRLWPSDACDFDCNYIIEVFFFRLLTSTFAWCACLLRVSMFFCQMLPSRRSLQLSGVQDAGRSTLDLSILPHQKKKIKEKRSICTPSSLFPSPSTPLIRRHLIPTIIARRLALFHTLQPSLFKLRPQIAYHIKIRMP
jgi:hypothetical protein